jgi:hypothetical protein
LEYPGAVYHVMARGNQGQPLFRDDRDRRVFLEVLAGWLRERTTVSLRWVAERLGMGHYTRVTQAVSRLKHRPGRRLRQMKSRLEKPAAPEDK